ncbi:MAG: DUF2975 domain-containing protein [Lachnospiraceae bacterium]|nr:DUF2975 domain-containing protein [Lachnospiraceae bacterium]
MKWNNNQSIILTQVLLILFAIALLALDIFMQPVLNWYLMLRNIGDLSLKVAMTITLYVSSAFVWLILIEMWILLRNLQKGRVFVEQNVTILRIVSYGFVALAISTFVGGFFYVPFFFVTVAAVFLTLIVRIVKNAFAEAVQMKSELDLTI